MAGMDQPDGTPKAILYARVSTDERTKGFSLRQQLEALREYAARRGYEIVEEIEDSGYSGAELVRPGLDHVRDLVEAEGALVVLAQDADLITREPIHRMILGEEAAKHGARIVALDDWGDDSHEGQLLKFMRGWVSKGERLKTAERTRRGSLRKVREGKLIRSRMPNYGFDYEESGDHYLVDEE
jgi:site-specific DNA recombinase